VSLDPSEAASLAQHAMQAYEKGEYDLAIDSFTQAKEAYAVAGKPQMAAEMANNLSVALGQVGRHQQALEVLEGTFEILLQHDELTKAAQALGNTAAAYEGLREWQRAESLYEQAAARFAQLGNMEGQRFTLQALSRVRLRQGRAVEAVTTMQGALDIESKPSWHSRLIRKFLDLPSRILKP
jgi:tetratricopeptide (TPR) repeat protein